MGKTPTLSPEAFASCKKLVAAIHEMENAPDFISKLECAPELHAPLMLGQHLMLSELVEKVDKLEEMLTQMVAPLMQEKLQQIMNRRPTDAAKPNGGGHAAGNYV